ncbi:hypothetical protein [Carnobacterium divergens]|uniref:hypothetical protein n=1 Tax=Carnobacterium divergens TaxID=2748 RepID=UPI00288CD9BF|nr:hypothetical protein [Carnobacterium divergens]MDT2012499.1 hypothetical protein [Carnobacterium divergens]
MKKILMAFVAVVSFSVLFIGNTEKVMANEIKSNPPIDSRIRFKGYDSNSGQSIAYMNIQSVNNWDYVMSDTLFSSAFYIESAGSGKYRIRSEKYNHEGYNYVVISNIGYLYLAQKEYAESFSFYTQPSGRYSIVSGGNEPLGFYNGYITTGGTRQANWDIIPS